MHRFLLLLVFFGVLTGLASGGFIHFEHHHGAGNDCAAGMALADDQHRDCHGEGEPAGCHQHACHHAIPPAVDGVPTRFVSTPRLLGNVPTPAVPSVDEPVYEPATPPLIGEA